ncbi:FAD-dependent oxidoreductase [Amycolatopsis anabasis]|uniref:FAD-dependent oxidoreductase n=1 Tax=Amycolatopsis anabasis TaxID=1840409 RepID=UPI0015D1772F|nr:FAD-dependent oxidoreductase [Amycolatopsis anabasis]
MTDSTSFDIIVVGGGPVGLSCGWQASAQGQRTLVLDRHGFFNEQCGTSGAERHWRLQYTQEDLFRLTLETLPLWRRLESLAERKLIHHIGSLWFGDIEVDTNEGQIAETARVMDKLELRYDWLTAKEIERRYGFTNLPKHYAGFMQPDGGAIDVRGTLAALYGLAQQHGCHLRGGERVLGLTPDADGVTVRTDRTTYRAAKVVLANGAEVNHLLTPLGATLDIKLYEMALVSLPRRDEDVDFPFWFVFQQPTEEDTNLFYGFGRNPWSPSELVRLGPVFEVNPIDDADQATGVPDPRHVRRLTSWVGEHVPSLDPTPAQTSTCLAVLPGDPRRQFYLGLADKLVPHGEHIVLYSSGWGFKFVPLLGEICVDLAMSGTTKHDISRLSPTATQEAQQ